jgi:hypothetical protein
MERDVGSDLVVGLEVYYGLTEQTAPQVALDIVRWVKEQLTLSDIPLSQRTTSQDEEYSLLIGRLIRSETVAAIVAKKLK